MYQREQIIAALQSRIQLTDSSVYAPSTADTSFSPTTGFITLPPGPEDGNAGRIPQQTWVAKPLRWLQVTCVIVQAGLVFLLIPYFKFKPWADADDPVAAVIALSTLVIFTVVACVIMLIFAILSVSPTSLTLDGDGLSITHRGKTSILRYTDVGSIVCGKAGRIYGPPITIIPKRGYFANMGMKRPYWTNGSFYPSFFSAKQSSEFLPLLTSRIQQAGGTYLAQNFAPGNADWLGVDTRR